MIAEFKRSGQIGHFDELVRRHIGSVRAMIYPMVLNDADADDLTQDVFLRAARGISGFKGKSEFSTWLYRIAVNTTRTFLRRRARRSVEVDIEPPEMVDHGSRPDRKFSAKESMDRVGAAMAALPPDLRAAITLMAIQGMSAKEAARVSDCLTATMYWRVHEARKRLKTLLEVEDHETTGSRTERLVGEQTG